MSSPTVRGHRRRTPIQPVGYEFDEAFSDDQALCLVVDRNIYVMLLLEERFRDFITGGIADPAQGTEVITSLSADSREGVDEGVQRALGAGGRAWRAPIDEEGMYAGSFQDPDGHVWELVPMAPSAMG